MAAQEFLDGITKTGSIENWKTIFILSVLLLYVITRLFFPKYWSRYQQAIVFPVEASKLLEEKNTNLLQASVLLNFLGVITICSFFYLAGESGLLILSPKPQRFFIILFAGVGMTLLKFYGIRILGYLFNKNDVATEYNHVWLIHLKFFGFVTLLWIVLITYLPDSYKQIGWYGGLCSIIIMLIMNNIRGVFIMIQSKISLLYGILYLCTLEILPILMIIRLIKI